MPSPKDIAAESGAPMIPEQRRELMLRQLRKHQVLSVHQLMEMFGCSHMTIRRDIALLEQEGRAYSVTGGVRIASQLHSEPSHQLVEADAELTYVPKQDCPTFKSAQPRHRQCFSRTQTGSVTSRQLGQFGVSANNLIYSRNR